MIARRGAKVLLEKRPPAGIWGGLWALPEFPTHAHASLWCREHLAAPGRVERGAALRHAFSHFDLDLLPLGVRCAGKAAVLRDDDRYRWYDLDAPAAVGLPKPIATLIARG